MHVYFLGTSIVDVLALTTGNINGQSNAVSHPTVFVEEGIQMANAGSFACNIKGVEVDEMYARINFRVTVATATAGLPIIYFVDAAGNELAGLYTAGAADTFRLQVGAAAAGSNFALTNNVHIRLDIHYKQANAGGRLAIYADGVLVSEFIGDTDPGLGAIADMRARSFGQSLYLSCMAVTDSDTRPLDVYQFLPSGDGAETAWAGTRTSVDETAFSDADFISSDTIDAVETMTKASFAVGVETTRVIHQISVNPRVRVNGGSPSKIAGIARIGGVNYEGTLIDPAAIGVYVNGERSTFDVNPATGLPWTVADFNGAQFGVKAKA